MTLPRGWVRARQWASETRLDLRYAWRSLGASPGFTVVIVLTFALAIGANAALFGALQAVLLEPLPFRDPGRIALLGEYSPTIDTQFVSPVTYDDWRARNEVFSEIAAFRYWQTVNLEDAGHEPEPIDLVTASANFFSVLGVAPLIGRTYQEEQNPRGGSEAIISYALWQRRYNRDPSVLGKMIRVRGTAATIVGVLPPTALNLSVGWGDVWTCLYRYDIRQMRASSYRARYLSVVGRLRPGLSWDQARLRMTVLQRQLWAEPASVAVGFDVRVMPITEALVGRARTTFVVLSCAVGLVLLVACANIANLLVVRAIAREQQSALRVALGATTVRIARLVLCESLLLAWAGTVCAIACAWGSLVLLRYVRPDIPRIADAVLTPRVFGVTLALALASAVLFSLAPLVTLAGRDVRHVLGHRGASGRAGAGRLRRILVASQMMLACLLLIVGGLLLRSLQHVLRVDTGFRPDHALVFDVYLPVSRYPGPTEQSRFYRELVRELRETPGVQSAGTLLYFPYKPKLWLTSLWVEKAPVADENRPVVYYNLAGGDFFATMGIPLEAGRWPTERESWEQPHLVVINRALARQVFGTGVALGQRIRTSADGPWREIIGVVGDVRQKRLEEPAAPELYETFAAMPMPFTSVVVRTAGAPDRLFDAIRDVVHRRDAGLAVSNLLPLDRYVAAHAAERRFAVILLELFATLAVTLAAVGVYGVMSYAVAERRREIAIRLALGAAPARVQRSVLRDGLSVAVAGGALGLVLAASTSGLLRSQLFGVGQFDPAIYSVVPIILLMVATLATWLPARRAARVDALAALRGE